MSTIFIRGPFTEDEMAKIIAVLSSIEYARPEEIFEVYIDDPNASKDVEALMEKLSPLRRGYERVVRYSHVKPSES